MTITDEMVEKAVREHLAIPPLTENFDALDKPHQTTLLAHMRKTLNTVAPLIRSAALEEAVRVADEERKRWNGKAGNDEFAAEGAASRILIAILALKDKQPDTRTPTEGVLL